MAFPYIVTKAHAASQLAFFGEHAVLADASAFADWLNQVERWFGLITQQAIRRGSFKSVPDLVGRIKRYTEHYNLTAQPFAWTATADSILAKLKRLCNAINGTEH